MQTEKGLERRIKQHVKAKDHTFFVITHPGFEHVTVNELQSNGISSPQIIAPGGIEFAGKLVDCYRTNLCVRSCTRVLMRIDDFKVTRFTKFKNKIKKIPWELYLDDGCPVSFQVTAHGSRLYHTGRIEQEAQKGIVQRLELYNKSICRTSVVNTDSVQTVFVRFVDDICQVSLDSSGDPLYKRGYKIIPGEAPLRESMAAGILQEALLLKHDTLIDPMAGSGTFSLEAILMYAGIMPGMRRQFAFEKWPAFSRAAFDHMKKEMDTLKVSKSSFKNVKIFCSDNNSDLVENLKKNLDSVGTDLNVAVSKQDFFDEPYPFDANQEVLLVINPPYGKRLKGKTDIRKLYKEIGEVIREKYKHCSVAIIVPGIEYENILNISYEKKLVFNHGGMRVAVLIKCKK